MTDTLGPQQGKYYTTLKFYDYERQNPFSPGDYTEGIANTNINLHLPIQLYDRTSSAFSQQNLGILGDLLNTGGGIIEGFNANGLEGALNQFNNQEGAATAIGLRAIGAVGGLIGPGGLLGRSPLGIVASQVIDPAAITTAAEQLIGAIPNPNPVVKYQGPQLRSFNYTWYFSPKNEQESRSIKKALRLIRRASLGGKTDGTGTALLQMPKLVQMNFFPWDKGSAADNKWGWGPDSLIRMKRCHITNVNINYNPANVPAFFWDNNPVIIELSIELQEVEYMFSDDWALGPDDSFGSNDAGDIDLPSLDDLAEFFEDPFGSVFGGDDGGDDRVSPEEVIEQQNEQEDEGE